MEQSACTILFSRKDQRPFYGPSFLVFDSFPVNSDIHKDDDDDDDDDNKQTKNSKSESFSNNL